MANPPQRKRWYGWRALAAGVLAALLLGAGATVLPRLFWNQVLGAELPAGTADVTLADLAAIPGVTPQYREAVNLFLQAQRSDNPRRDYSACIAAFERLAKTTDNPELRLRSHYFLTFALFLQRDVEPAYQHARQVLVLARDLYRDDPRAVLANRLATQAETGAVSLSDVRIALAAQAGPECSRLAGDLGRYAKPPAR